MRSLSPCPYHAAVSITLMPALTASTTTAHDSSSVQSARNEPESDDAPNESSETSRPSRPSGR